VTKTTPKHAGKPAAAKPTVATTAGKETSPQVAAAAAKLMHSDDANVRKVAASALAQVEHDTRATDKLTHLGAQAVKPRLQSVGVVPPPFNADDFRAQLPTLCVSGTVGFNLSTRDEVEQVVAIARELGYEATADVELLRVEVRRAT
jgi:hypothetical protein